MSILHFVLKLRPAGFEAIGPLVLGRERRAWRAALAQSYGTATCLFKR